MKSIVLLILLCGMFFITVHANIWMPALFLADKELSLYDFLIVCAAYIADVCAIKYLIQKEKWLKVIGAATIVNAVSIAMGFLCTIIYDFMGWYIRNAIELLFGFSPISLSLWVIALYSILFFLGFILLNTIIEGIVAIWIFPSIHRTRLFYLLLTINVLVLMAHGVVMGARIYSGIPLYSDSDALFEKMEQEDIRIKRTCPY